jgi:hypothetical protein
MQFKFELGDNEKSSVDFSFNQFWGNLKISVNGATIKTDLLLISLKLVKKYEFYVGKMERYHVRIEQERKLLFAAFRKHKYRVFIDGELKHEYEGY